MHGGWIYPIEVHFLNLRWDAIESDVAVTSSKSTLNNIIHSYM